MTRDHHGVIGPVRCVKAARLRPIVHGRFGAGHRGRVASRDAACVVIPRAHCCWLGESPPRRSDRISPRGESHPPRGTWSATASAHSRPAPSTRGARQATWPARIDGGGRYRHSGHDSPLAPEVDRPEVRWQSSKTARPPDDATRDRRPRGADGGRESAVGLYADPRCACQRGPRGCPEHGETDPTGPRDRPVVLERSRHTPWKTFLLAHWAGLAAADFFTVEVLTLTGLKRYLCLLDRAADAPCTDRRHPPAALRRVGGVTGPHAHGSR